MKLWRMSIVAILILNLGLQARDMGTIAQELKQGSTAGLGSIYRRKILSFPHSNITSLKGLDQMPVENAWVVNVPGNDIQVLRAGSFKDPKYSSIRWLNLSNNNLREIEPGAFEGLDNLQVLFLGKNELTSFKPGTFRELKKLKVLTLNGNPDDVALKRQARKQLSGTLITTKRLTRRFANWTLALVGIAATLTGAGVLLLSSKGKERPEPSRLVIGEPKGFEHEGGRGTPETISLEEARRREGYVGPSVEPEIQGVGLYEAASAGSLQTIEQLLDRGADPNKKYTVYQKTPLMAAAEAGFDASVRALIERGANVTLTDAQGRTALALTPAKYVRTRELLGGAQRSPLEGVSPEIPREQVDEGEYEERFLEKLRREREAELGTVGLRPTAKTSAQLAATETYPFSGVQSLDDAVAAETRGIPTVKKLLAQEGANINERFGPRQMTPLMLAAEKGDVKMVKFLIFNGADATLTDAQGNTAADIAWDQRRTEGDSTPYSEITFFLEKKAFEKKKHSSKDLLSEDI